MSTGPQIQLQLISNGRITMRCELAPDGIKTSDGWGGWQEVSRPRRKAMTEWRGPAPFKATLALLFDGWVVNHTTSRALQFLTGNFAPSSGTVEPPRFRVHGAWPLSSATQFVCNGLAIDPAADAIVRRSDRNAIRTTVTLSLLEYVPGDVVVKQSAAKRAAGRSTSPGTSGARKQSYVVHSGDTLSSIAAKQLGDYRKASQIASLNGLRTSAILTVGRRLKLPS